MEAKTKNLNNYAEARALVALVEHEDMAKEEMVKIEHLFLLALTSLKRDYTYFMRNHITTEYTVAEYRKHLTPEQLLDFKRTLRSFRAEVDDFGEQYFRPKYVNALDSYNNRVQLNRKDVWDITSRHRVEVLGAKQEKQMDDFGRIVFMDSFLRLFYDYDKAGLLDMDVSRYRDLIVQRRINTVFGGSDFRSRIWGNMDNLMMDLSIILPRGLARDVGDKELNSEIEKRLKRAENYAKTQLSDLTNEVHNDGFKTFAKEVDVGKRYRFVAVLDHRTSDICRSMDNKEFLWKDAQAGINLPPMHNNCRSTAATIHDDPELDEYLDKRLAEDADGNPIWIDGDMSYYDWAEAYGTEEFKASVRKRKNKK